MYTITLNDGTKFEGLTLSGTTFLAGYELTREMFPASKLRGVIIDWTAEPVEAVQGSDGEEQPIEIPDSDMVGTHDYMKLIDAGEAGWAFPNQWRVILADYTRAELKEMQTQGNIEYLAMMTGVEL